MPAHTPSGSFLVYTHASSLNCAVSPFNPPPPTRLAKNSSTSAPVTTSTMLVSENGLPVSCVSNFAISSFLSRRRWTALSSIRARAIAGVKDHGRKALCADLMAASTSDSDATNTSARGCAVEGSMDLKVRPDEATCT